MPRLSLYRPTKTADYEFLDGVIQEQFMVGGTDVYVHKYIGTVAPTADDASPSQPIQNNIIPELAIQDLLLLENRDRKYEDDVYITRCIYNMQQLDFTLSQFGLFLANDTLFIHFHLNDSVKTLGRKIMAGDVLELPHLADPYALNDAGVALRRFYVVDDVLRPTEGFSQTWFPHLVKVKCKPLVDSQEFKDILDKPAVSDLGPYATVGTNDTLRDIISNFNIGTEINNAVLAQAEADAPKSGYDTDSLWMVPVDANGKVLLNDAGQNQDASQLATDVSSLQLDASLTLKTPEQDYYLGYLSGDGIPPNGQRLLGMGAQFPEGAFTGAFYLRTDFLPNRLFRYSGTRWVKFEDNVRMTMNNDSTRKTYTTDFVNNNTVTDFGSKVIDEKQPLSKTKDLAKKLRPDN